MGEKKDNAAKPVKLGETYRDEITGFEGVAVARTEYLYGCVRVCLESRVLKDDGKVNEQFFDEQRLTTNASATSGGPGAAPPSRDPVR